MSLSLRLVDRAASDWFALPGARRFIIAAIASKSTFMPAGKPSRTTPIASPCDSPNTDSFSFLP